MMRCTIDADGVARAAIQGLHQLVPERDARIEAQQREIKDLRERMAKSNQYAANWTR